MNFKLPDSIYSPEQLEASIMALESYVSAHLHAAKKAAKGSAAEQDLYPDLQSLIDAWSPEQEMSAESAEKLIAAVKVLKREAPVVHLTFAAPAGSQLKLQFVRWIRHNLGEGILVSFGFNRDLLGGLVLRTSSRLYDWSFRAKLLGQRDKLGEALRRV